MKKSLHKKTSVFIRKGLFDQISGFRELESRISLLPTEKERGDAFEIFAEAYLNTQSLVHGEQNLLGEAPGPPMKVKCRPQRGQRPFWFRTRLR